MDEGSGERGPGGSISVRAGRGAAAAGLVIALILGASSLAEPAGASEEMTPEPGRAYRVVGVAAGDVLNLRAAPGAGAARLGALPPAATDVVVTGVRQEVSGAVWWEVALAGAGQDQDAAPRWAWVNARYLTPMDLDRPPQEDFALQCLGTEPFWSLRIEDETARFSTPEGESPVWAAGPRREAAGMTGRFARRLDGPARPAGELPGDDAARDAAPGHIVVARTYRFCSDAMSDRQYPFEATLITPGGTDGGAVFGGCCRRAR